VSELAVVLVTALVTLTAVAVGALVAGLPNSAATEARRAVQQRLDRMLDAQERTLRRQTDLVLSAGNVPVFTALRAADEPDGHHPVAAPAREQEVISYDDPNDIPDLADRAWVDGTTGSGLLD